MKRPFFWVNAFATWGTFLQFAIILTHCLVLWRYSDVTWWGTLVAFAPRWPFGVLLGLMLPVALMLRLWRLVLINVFSAAIVVFPVMGLEASGMGRGCPSQNGMNLRVLTCNVRGNAFSPVELNRVIAETAADVVALQECPPGIVENCFRDEAWFTKVVGELCVASRFPIQSAVALDRAKLNGWGSFALLCRIEGPDGDFEVVSVHLLSPRQGLESLRAEGPQAAVRAQEVFQVRHEESKQIYRELRNIPVPIVLAGDFNLTPESRIYRKYLLQYADAFSEAGTGFGYTRPTRWHGVRIDHVLADHGWTVECCRVCDDVGSDHLPVVAELRRVASSVDGNL